MATNSSLPTLAQACQGPLVWRVQSATRILQEGSSKEVATVLRTLIHSVFGAAGPAEPGMLGWGLQHFTKAQHPAEFQLLCDFLSARGPLVGTALRHAHDTFMLFEFPIASLPALAQAAIAEGKAGALYANKITNPGPGKTPVSILLNSFEFYMFHFCHYLLHVGVAEGCGGLTWTGVGDAVYPSLLEDYLTTFLPCHDAAPPHIPSSSAPPCAPHTPLAARLTASGLQHLTQFMSPISTPQVGGVLQAHPLFGGASPHTSSPFPNSHLPQRPAAWVSQTVVQVLVEMWVNQCGASQGRPASPLSPSASIRSPLPPGSPQPQMPSWMECAASVQYRPHWFVPPTLFGIGASVMCEHIRAVRMVIKHLHYFSNSVKPAQPSPLDNLRRSVWLMCRRSFYTLFMQLLQRWPLDSSFRLLLEAWLSYIQPWRYTNINKPADPSESGVPVEWQWQRFIAENLLFYSSVLTAVMPRLLRLDLSAPKNAHMLYRICKVFSLPNFGTMLKATEDALLAHPHTLMSPTSPQRMQSVQQGGQQGQLPAQAVAVAVRSHILEMENNNHFVYTSIFGSQTQSLARQVLRSVRAAEAAVTGELDAMDQPPAPGSKVGMLRGVWEWLVAATSSSASDDNTTDELRRSLLHLQAAADHLQHLFQISEDVQLSFASDSSPCKSKSAVPDQISTDHGMVLSDQGRRQLVCGLRRKDVKYEGDPDLRPISCSELAVLVRWLYVLACHLNTQYGAELRSGYYSGGVQGVLWRCVLQPPLIVYEYRKQVTSSDPCGALYPVRVSRMLPPRLSFRRVASRQLLVSVLMITLILSVVFGMSLPSQLVYVAAPALLLYLTAQLVVGRALLRPQHPLNSAEED
ncbi:Sphingomyelin phosphodiesterase 4 [Trinorchestia longiramus]|nr:Sphingomyelin phosphodiesterase 4 [Trinorchestia longiramus]